VRIAAAVLVDSRDRTLLTKIPGAHDSVLFSRLWQFPAIAIATNGGGAHSPANELAEYLRASLKISTQFLTALPLVTHAVTFRKVTLAPFLARVTRLPKRPNCRTLPLAKLARLPISSATQKIARAALVALA
jgi:hypothetical protein